MKTKQNKKDESKDCNLSGKDMVPSTELYQAQDGGPGGEGQERKNGIGLLKTEGCGHCLSPARIAKPPQAATWLLLAWLFMLGKHWAIWRLVSFIGWPLVFCICDKLKLSLDEVCTGISMLGGQVRIVRGYFIAKTVSYQC